MDLEIAGGAIESDLLMVSGKRAARFARQAAGELEFAILSATALFAQKGPAGKEHWSLDIKRAAVETARRIVWVADYTKLSDAYKDEPLVYVFPEQWKAAAARKNMWVVTSRHPDVPAARAGDPIRTDESRRTRAEWYCYNRDMLKELLGQDRVIEV